MGVPVVVARVKLLLYDLIKSSNVTAQFWSLFYFTLKPSGEIESSTSIKRMIAFCVVFNLPAKVYCLIYVDVWQVIKVDVSWQPFKKKKIAFKLLFMV